MLQGKCVVLGVSGGIAAYKAAEIVRALVKEGALVRVVMTRNACQFITPLTLSTLSGNPVYVDSFERSWEIEHIALAKQADLMLIAPATANVLGKMASGIADDLLSTTFMAMPAPVLAAPAMNSVMWKSAACQANVALLESRGVHFVGPDSGQLACGDTDVGRMSDPDKIVKAACGLICPKQDLRGRHILVTAGPTREMIDPVRFLSNRSSGKMGYAIAQAAARRGARVTLVSGPVSLAPVRGVEMVSITSTLQLHDEVVRRAAQSDAVIQAAAPADFRPAHTADSKIKKTGEGMTLELTPNPDIAYELGRAKRPGQVLVIFAAETDHVLENARGKLARKNADLVVANDVARPDAGFAVDTNLVTLIGRDEVKELPLLKKAEVADRILDEVAARLEQ